MYVDTKLLIKVRAGGRAQLEHTTEHFNKYHQGVRDVCLLLCNFAVKERPSSSQANDSSANHKQRTWPVIRLIELMKSSMATNDTMWTEPRLLNRALLNQGHGHHLTAILGHVYYE